MRENSGQVDNRKKEVIDALSECYGIVTDACRKTDVPRSTFYKWLNEDEEFKAAVGETQEEAIDFVEGQLFKKISGVEVQQGENIYSQPPSDTAIIFYLKTKAKKRGYVEKQEVLHSGRVTNIIIEEVSDDDNAGGESSDKNNEGFQKESVSL